ncbi:helix-turn-helix transcriptional regulator [Limibacterium fermenti]|uniref:helix-turn-helix transcriptional regulator n=1 Tax=Limibacterium fermenti TaxID=3229863 RepID=UPI003A704F13
MTELTKRENQVAGLTACGLAKKEIACELSISYGTVSILLDRCYRKTGTSKLNELAGWWLNEHFSLGIDFEELKKRGTPITSKMIRGIRTFVFDRRW